MPFCGNGNPSYVGAGSVGPQGPQGVPGSGTSFPAATPITASGVVPTGTWIEEDIDMSQPVQIVRTMPHAPVNGSVYWIHTLNATTNPNAPLQPVLFVSDTNTPLEDPERPGITVAGPPGQTVKTAICGDSICWQFSSTYGWMIRARAMPLQAPQ